MPSDTLIEIDFDSFADNFGLAGATELFTELHYGTMAKKVTHHFREVENARAMQGMGEIAGIGHCSTVLDPTSFHYWGQRLGYGCWDDEEFLREFRRDNPLSKVQYCSGKTTILNQWGNSAREEEAA